MRAFLLRCVKNSWLASGTLLFAASTLHAGDSPSSAATTPKVHTVMIEGMEFSPQVTEINVGDTVVWTNKDMFPHDATADDSSFQSPEIRPGRSWKFTAVKKGTFSYICTLHPTMKGSLTVK